MNRIMNIFCLLLLMIASDALPQRASEIMSAEVPVGTLGQSATELPDGRWLLIGGESLSGSLNTARIWNPRTGVITEIPGRLQQARAWHTATMLPDGNVLVLGGISPTGQVVSAPEIFNPQTHTFNIEHSVLGLIPRSRHTATLLPDGHILIAGGRGPSGEILATSELWNTLETGPIVQLSPLSTPRSAHSASLTENGEVLLRDGVDSAGLALTNQSLI